MKDDIIKITEDFAKDIHKHDSSGHDFAHIDRVRKLALYIGEHEGADLFIVEMAALLHDTVDEKLFNEQSAWERLDHFYTTTGLSDTQKAQINHILCYMSFKGGANEGKLKSLEGFVVQDADRIDALGAIGIARTFMFAGKFGEAMYDPEIQPREDLSNYRTPGTAINHFYEKLFKLIHLMNTETGRQIAQSRNDYMQQFIDTFLQEWYGKKL
ncbi:HD domain-containing protein [Macrococcoides caseolyticum]|uniref:HD domain-containing protein n=1 Tax=Macrococcoides caseolyticum TaxID=69966 RepID=UPI000C326320|nr:HD domain-containing protein [Macrococcus caseolyticus]PKE10041.1 phosphohydrolase [Macrococcus caseolyticus]PKE46644.1 phosphohydrolase [Macrococcus caseolyticus]PKF13179.1 phosphohydrolase [Macrococcus caseolyticus]PNZ72940.1 HD domain-containing protein [Macrococcus caseolyticus]QPT46128.1 HD domain-containing protein [Macrococcus caseolyticus]